MGSKSADDLAAKPFEKQPPPDAFFAAADRAPMSDMPVPIIVTCHHASDRSLPASQRKFDLRTRNRTSLQPGVACCSSRAEGRAGRRTPAELAWGGLSCSHRGHFIEVVRPRAQQLPFGRLLCPWTSARALLGCRQNAELPEEIARVPVDPVVQVLAVLKLRHRAAVGNGLSARGRDAH